MLSQTKKDNLIQEFKVHLKQHNLKATPQRLAVHEAMIELGHATPDQVVEHVSKSDRSATTSSVYNILSQMADLGIYAMRLSTNNKMIFDVTTTRHIHLYDTEGNEMKDIIDDELLALVESKLLRKRFKGLKLDRVEITLLCHPSKKKTTARG